MTGSIGSTDSSGSQAPAGRRESGIGARLDEWAGLLVMRLGTMMPAAAVGAIGATIVISWVALYLAGGAGHVPPHWFYVPILLAAVRFGSSALSSRPSSPGS